MIKRFMNNTSKKGISLIELIVAISLASIVIGISANMLIFGTKTHMFTSNEYRLQSDARIAAEKVTNIVRYSKATFAVPYTFIETTAKMDPGWSYFMVSPDKKQIVSMDYNAVTSKHEPTVVVAAQNNIEYELLFEKDTSAKTDNVMKYKIVAHRIDGSGKRLNQKVLFESKVESVNAVQVADKGTSAAPSIALAYRNDGQTSGDGRNDIAYITIITDVSGSMRFTPNGYDYGYEVSNSRIKYLRQALVGKGTTEGIIQRFAKEENVFISLVPFSDTANTPNPTANVNPGARHTIYEVYNDTDEALAIQMAKSLVANGGTNTGDALRQAYHLHNDFRSRKGIKSTDAVHHYTILLVDGQTNYETKTQEWRDNGRYITKHSGILWWRISYNEWIPKAEKVTDLQEYTGVGNVDTKTINNTYSFPKTVVNNPVDGGTYGQRNNNVKIIGTSTDVGTFIKTMGDLIKKFDGNNGIRSYIIGYSSGLNNEIKDIGDSIGTETANRYLYNSSSFNLDEIFSNIANDIMADFWVATGPKIQ